MCFEGNEDVMIHGAQYTRAVMVVDATHGAEVLLILVLVAHPQLLQQVYTQTGKSQRQEML